MWVMRMHALKCERHKHKEKKNKRKRDKYIVEDLFSR